MAQSQADLIDLYRASLKSAADLVMASLQGTERLQNQQLAAVRAAIAVQARSMAELGEAKTLDQLMALQSRMAGEQIERAVGFWTDMFQGQVDLSARATEEAAKFAAVASGTAALRTGPAEKQRKSA